MVLEKSASCLFFGICNRSHTHINCRRFELITICQRGWSNESLFYFSALCLVVVVDHSVAQKPKKEIRTCHRLGDWNRNYLQTNRIHNDIYSNSLVARKVWLA